MKKINLILEVLLAIAVIALFVLHFTGNKADSHNATPASTAGGKAPAGTIAYVDMETLIGNYEMFADFQKKFSDKKQQFESEMKSKSQNYKNRVQDYQTKVQKGLTTRSAAEETEQKLAAEQQKLLQLRDQYMTQLAEEEQGMKRQILNSVMEFMTPYSKTKGYAYVLGNESNGTILHADKTMDITQDVLKELNARYKSEKEKGGNK
jgi:outer membrane protein